MMQGLITVYWIATIALVFGGPYACLFGFMANNRRAVQAGLRMLKTGCVMMAIFTCALFIAAYLRT